MIETYDISVDEIVRIGRWALRGLGMQFGVSERGAHLLAWTEAVEGGALRWLGDYDLRRAAGEIGPFRIERLADDRWAARTGGRSLLEVGPVGIDLLTYAARTFGAGRLDLLGVSDPLFLTGLCRLALQRGLGALVLSDAAGLQIGGTPAKAIEARLDDRGTMLFAEAGDLARHPAAGRSWNVEAPSGEGEAISLFLHPLAPEAERRPRGVAELALEESLMSAHAHGIRVAAEDFDRFCDFEVRTWAPTSDRSRSQALV